MTPGTGYYDSEAPRYDESRGGRGRARAAAVAVADLVPAGGLALDVGGGTGIVSAELAARGWSVLVVDGSLGMLHVAAERLPGQVMKASAAGLPVRSGSADLVVTIWLLHLLPVEVADGVVAEAARVLRHGGHLVTTVDKDLAHGARRRTVADERERVRDLAADLGLVESGEAVFSGASRWGSATEDDPLFRLVAFRKVSG